MNPKPPERLEDEVAELRARVRRLEEALYRQGIVAERWKGLPAESAAPVQAREPSPPAVVSPAPPVAGPPPAAVPIFASIEPLSKTEERSLESRIGSQWFNRIGILAVLIAMAWFLKLAIDNHWIGPLGRVLIGLVAGAGLIAWSEWFRGRGYSVFSYSLKSIGSGALYLSIWAAFSLYHLIPPTVAFAAMVAITAFNAYLSWVQDAELLALYAIAGGFSTPLLVSTGENHEVALFSYMLLLDLAVLVLVALRPWSRLLFGAFLGTVFYVTAWALEFYSAPQAWATAVFVGGFFVLFALAPRLVRMGATGEGRSAAFTPGWDNLATVLLPLLNAGLGFLAFYLILDSRHADWAQPWLAVVFAAFYLLLLRLPASGRWRDSPFLLADLHLAVAVVFLTIAIPLKASGRWITMGWLVEGAALLWVAGRTRLVLIRVLAVGCLVLSLGALIVDNPPAAATPIFNQRFLTFAVAIAVFAVSGWMASQQAAEENRESVLRWPSIALACALLVNVLILTAVSLEIHAYWSAQRGHGPAEKFVPYTMYAQFTYSAFFMLFGAVLLALGFARHSALLRWQALVLVAFSIGKVFLVDVSELSQGYRILSFLGLGVLLLGVSFVYQRDWFNLRGRGGRAS